MVLQGRFAGRRPFPSQPAAAPVQAKMRAGAEAFSVDLRLGQADGKPLPAGLRSTMEAAFGAGFSDVRVRVGPEASSIGALAFTVGSRIFFAQGQYNPDTVQGRMLIGHELAHVLQQRAGRDEDDDPYRKTFPKLVGIEKKSKRTAARKHKLIKVSDRLSKRQKARLGVDEEDDLPVRPNYVPTRDTLGNAIWDGRRSGLDFSGPVKTAMAATKAGGCQLQKPVICTGGADGIDHVEDFATAQSGLTRYVICDGQHHWSACYKQDAQDCYDAYGDTSGLKWSCTQCNSSKSGARGRYENQPAWIGRCPGGCDYSHKGEEALL